MVDGHADRKAVVSGPVQRDRTKGVGILLLGVLCVSPDALLLKLMYDMSMTVFAILAWKNFFAFFIFLVIATYDRGSWTGVVDAWMKYPHYMIPGGIAGAVIDSGYSVALIETTAARAMLLISLNPIWSAVLGELVMGDPVKPRVIVAVFFAMVSVILIFMPNVLGEGDGKGASMFGDLVAFVNGIFVSCRITYVRWVSLREGGSEVPMNITPMLGYPIIVTYSIIGLLITGDRFYPTYDVGDFYGYSLADGFAVLSLGLAVSTAPKYITGPEVSMIILLEAILGPLWVFLAIGEQPSTWTLIGGGVLIATCLVHELLAFFDTDDPAAKKDDPNDERTPLVVSSTPAEEL